MEQLKHAFEVMKTPSLQAKTKDDEVMKTPSLAKTKD